MNREALQFLSELAPFDTLPRDELERIADEITEKHVPEEETIAIQGRTKIENILVVKSGALKLYYDRHDEKIQVWFLRRGEIFGGISVLMNEGISVRTVEVEEKADLYMFSLALFQDLCSRHKSFYEYFLESFKKQMLDESYAAVIRANQAIRFLSDIPPFSFLPGEEIETLAVELKKTRYPKDKVIFVQGRSKVEHLYIVEKGAAERYYEEKDEKILRGLIGEGDFYGGISILMNNAVAVRTLKTQETTYFYLLPKTVFLDICSRYPDFSDFFSDTFGKRMLDRTYAEVVTKAIRPKEEGSHYFNRPLGEIYSTEILYCSPLTSIQEAAEMMSEKKYSAIFVRDSVGEYVGIVTDNDLRRKVIARGCDIKKPVREIMSYPLRTIPAQAMIFETLMEMVAANVKHLAVTDAEDKVVGLVSNRDLLTAHGQSPFVFIREIAAAQTFDEITERRKGLPAIIGNLIRSGAKANNVTSFITAVSDTILEKLIQMALDELGPPPVKFAFMIMGSEGRKEQTLKTDQDNAIIFEDVAENLGEEVRAYFLSFGEKVCNRLNDAGYDFCEGNVMAKNPMWCQPLSIWKQHFSGWIHAAEPEDLLQASIFFDFRRAYGDEDLVESLREFLFNSLLGWTGFFRHMAENALHFKPPLGFFRNFVVESKGQHKNKFDIKSAMMPIVDFARIYSLQHSIDETNTLERLHQLYIKDVISWEEYNELEQGYGFLMQIRFVRQVTAVLEEGEKPDNFINPKKLSNIEQTMVKEIFKRIEKYQSKLNFDFIGII